MRFLRLFCMRNVSRGQSTRRTRKTAANPPVAVQDVSDNSDADRLPPAMANFLLEMRSDQLEFQETIRKEIQGCKAGTVKSAPVPTLTSKSLAKQHEFNVSTLQNLEEMKESSSDPKIVEMVNSEIGRIRSRNNKILFADRFPGGLTVLDSLQELAELKKDPEVSPFLTEALQQLRPQGSPFGYRGRFRGPPISVSSVPRNVFAPS